MATEMGFSPLGMASDIIHKELGEAAHNLRALADWNHFENDQISIVGIRNPNPSRLKGIVLAPCESSKCYADRMRSRYGSLYEDGLNRRFPPDRAFYYSVSYESIAYAVHECQARSIGITHLSASGRYHEDIATCTAEALAHFHDRYSGTIEQFAFLGCCIKEQHLYGIRRLNAETHTGHRRIPKKTRREGFADIIDLQW